MATLIGWLADSLNACMKLLMRLLLVVLTLALALTVVIARQPKVVFVVFQAFKRKTVACCCWIDMEMACNTNTPTLQHMCIWANVCICVDEL